MKKKSDQTFMKENMLNTKKKYDTSKTNFYHIDETWSMDWKK